MPWSKQDLAAIAAADGLKIAPFRADGKTPGTPVFVWAVVLPGAGGAAGRLFVRAYNGAASRWFQAARQQKAGEIYAAGAVYSARFAPAADSILNAQIDRAYQAKYSGSPYCSAMISPRARAATVEILPA